MAGANAPVGAATCQPIAASSDRSHAPLNGDQWRAVAAPPADGFIASA
jgi:hypothetical protein